VGNKDDVSAKPLEALERLLFDELLLGDVIDDVDDDDDDESVV
jgi:hypothetical protein